MLRDLSDKDSINIAAVAPAENGPLKVLEPLTLAANFDYTVVDCSASGRTICDVSVRNYYFYYIVM